MELPLGRFCRPPRPTQVVGGYPPFAVMTSLLGGHDVFLSLCCPLQLFARPCGGLVTLMLHRHEGIRSNTPATGP